MRREEGVALTPDDVGGHCGCDRDGDLPDVLQRRVAAALGQQVGGRQGCQRGRRDEEVFVRQMSGSHCYCSEAHTREDVPIESNSTVSYTQSTSRHSDQNRTELMCITHYCTHSRVVALAWDELPPIRQLHLREGTAAGEDAPTCGDRVEGEDWMNVDESMRS